MKPPSIENDRESSRYRSAPYYEIARHSHNYSDEIVRFYSDNGEVVATKTVHESDANKNKRTKRIPPSRQKSKQRRAAFRMYELIKCIPEQARTESQKSSFEWALSVVGDLVQTERKSGGSKHSSSGSHKRLEHEHHQSIQKKFDQKPSVDWVERLVDRLFEDPTNSKLEHQQFKDNQQRSPVERKSFKEDQFTRMEFIDRNGHNNGSHSNVVAKFNSYHEKRNKNEHNTNKNDHNGINADHSSDHILAIIDKNQLDGSITPTKWNKVQVRLASIFLSVLHEHPGPAPTCSDCGWHQNRYKLIACTDKRSAELYKIAISRIGEVWPGADLTVIARNQIPNAPRAVCRMPAEPSDTQTILEIIRVSNPQLPTSTWKITKLPARMGDYRIVTFAINAESLELLARTDGVINYGFTGITMKVLKSDEMFFKNVTTMIE